MKDLELDFVQRLKTADLLGKATGTMDKIITLAEVHRIVRFTEQEMTQIAVTDLGNGVQSFVPPYPTFGGLVTQIEDAQATALLSELNAHQGWTINDVGWSAGLKRQLMAPSVKPAAAAGLQIT